jgi:hypothetical protein
MTDLAVVPAGVWEHRSGQRYLALGVGRFDEDDDEVVVYVRLYERPAGGLPISVRRVTDFLAPVEWPDGSTAPRFRFVGPAEPSDRDRPRKPGGNYFEADVDVADRPTG